MKDASNSVPKRCSCGPSVSDLVERLRAWPSTRVEEEAATEIERLQAVTLAIGPLRTQLEKAWDEIKRLQAALMEIKRHTDCHDKPSR